MLTLIFSARLQDLRNQKRSKLKDMVLKKSERGEIDPIKLDVLQEQSINDHDPGCNYLPSAFIRWNIMFTREQLESVEK